MLWMLGTGSLPNYVTCGDRWKPFMANLQRAAVALSLANLGHPDRYIRYAARVALEFQPINEWENEVLSLADQLLLSMG